MKSFLATIFAASVAAAPQAGTATEPLLFTAIAQGPSGTALNAGIINANGGAFWVGKPAATAGDGGDPLSAVNTENAKNGNTTIFSYINGEGTLSLSAGLHGQSVFVGSDGKLGFGTLADSGTYPAGAAGTGFANVYDATLKFEQKGWYGCPEQGSSEVYGIYAESRSSGEGCQGFTFKLQQVQPPYNGGPSTAWQYV